MISALEVIKGGGVFDLPEIGGEECQERWVRFYFVFVWGFFLRCAHLYFYDKDDKEITAVRQWCCRKNAAGIIEVASVIKWSEASGQVAAGLFMTGGNWVLPTRTTS